MKKLLVFVASVFCGAILAAQTPDHLNMNLAFSGDSLFVEVEYLARPQVASDSLFFILNPGFQLDTIQAPNLKGYSSGQRPDRPFPGQVLHFEESLKSETFITFKYTMDLSVSNHWDSGWIELNVDKLWFPIRGDLDNPITWEVAITGFPDQFDLVSHMDAFLERQGSHVHIVQPHPKQEVLILAGAAMKHLQLSDSIAFFAGEQVPDSLLRSIYLKVRNSIDFLNETVGPEEPITDFRVVLRNTTRNELGFQFNRRDMIVTGPDFDDYGNLSHEIAHFWWRGADFIREPWMNESFANYLMFMVLERFDPEGYKKVLENFRKTAEKAPPVAGATAFGKNAYPAYYHKGALLLKTLEDQIGKGPMIQILRRCISQDIHSTDGFIDVLRDREGDAVADRFLESLSR